jgi:hypothetical protein
MKTCFCGSGKPRRANHDARGIFLTFTCDDCHEQKMSGFRPEILTNPNYEADEPIAAD